jgi:hypothetical protein
MKHVLITSLLCLGLVAPAAADVTIRQSSTGKGMGMSGTTKTVTYIKGSKMRTDMVDGDRTNSTIFDLDAQKMYSFDSRRKEADVWDMATFSAQMSKTVDTSNIKASVKPNGQTREIAGQKANGYDMEISVPAGAGENKEMQMTVTMTGPVWIVKNAPGTADYLRFYKSAVEKGWIFGNPQQAKAQPGQAKAMAEMYRQMAETGGIPYQTEMSMKMGMAGGGSNPLSGMFAKLGNITMTSTVETVETTALADDLFAPPAGYKLNVKK